MKNIYGLHICKTGGRFYHRSVLIPTIQAAYKQIPVIQNGRAGHYGWHESIEDTTFIVSGIRDVVKQQCSLFIDLNLRAKSFGEPYFFSKKDFLEWTTSPISKNNMSKHFFYSTQIWDFGKDLEPRQMEDFNLIKERASRVNLYYDIDEGFTTAELSKKLSAAMGIEYRPRLEANTMPIGENPQSKALYESLNESEKDYVRSVSFLDYKMYEFIKSLGK
jgi:hypothetical protein